MALLFTSVFASFVCIPYAWPVHSDSQHFSATRIKENTAAAAVSSRGAVILQCGNTFRQSWYGRLGNNILSILNAALDAESRGLSFYQENCFHSILDLSAYDYYSSSSLSQQKTRHNLVIKQALTPAEAFYINIYNYPEELEGLELILPFPSACCSRKRILTPLLEKYYSHPAAFKYPSDALVMHIRSGDIFDTTRPAEHRYTPPPLIYYKKVIDEHQSRHSSSSGGASIVIVTEMDHISPLVDYLLKSYPQGTITIQAGSLEEDVAVVLAARHLVASQGTFAYALALASHNLETLYMFNNIVHALDDRPFCDIKEVHHYSPRGGKYIEQWEASEGQIKYLLKFEVNDLVESIVEGSNNTCFAPSLL